MHLATGDIQVQRGRLPEGVAGVDATVQMMSKMAKGEYGSRSAKIRALSINLVNAAKVADKDYFGMAQAIHNWVRDQIRYVKDPIGDAEDGSTLNQETLSYPEETAFNSLAGDCLVGTTRLLTPTGYKTIKDVRPGDIIQGRNGWTKVVQWWDKGVLPVKVYDLDNGGEFIATDDHRCILLSGAEVRAADLVEGAALCGPVPITLSPKDAFITEQDCFFFGVFLADGWIDGNRACVSGKDGFAKEQQKRWVADYAAGKGWTTSWHPRYIRVYIPTTDPLYELVFRTDTAEGKEIPAEIMACLDHAKAKRLLDGLLSDSHHPMETKRSLDAVEHRSPVSVRRSGLCYSTISDVLAKQVRLLFRYQGIGVRDTLVVEHGGLGTHPVHRIYPRFFRPKPARVEGIEDAGDQHVYDIETEDHGIYLPDADIVVHNCDDKTILEMAMLGSLGIQSYPVVIGTTPGRYSHVYLNIILPPGKYPRAGETIPADPIMREWPLGKEAPAYKVKMKKLYTDLAGIGTMDIGSYASAPSYLDTKNLSSIVPALRSRITDTGSRGRIMNVAEVTRPSEDLDVMFDRDVTLNVATDSADRNSLRPLGPITARREQALTSYLKQAPIIARRRTDGPVIRTIDTRVNRNSVTDLPANVGAPTATELRGLSDYLSLLEQDINACASFQGLSGPSDPVNKAAAALIHANSRSRLSSAVVNRIYRTVGMFGLGANDAPALSDAQKTEQLAHAVTQKAKALAKKSTNGSPVRAAHLHKMLDRLKHLDVAFGVPDYNAKMGTDLDPVRHAAAKVIVLSDIMHDQESIVAAHRELHERAAKAVPSNPLKTRIPGGTVRDQMGRIIYSDDLAGGFGRRLRRAIPGGTKKGILRNVAVDLLSPVGPVKLLTSVTKKVSNRNAVTAKILKGFTNVVAPKRLLKHSSGRSGGRGIGPQPADPNEGPTTGGSGSGYDSSTAPITYPQDQSPTPDTTFDSTSAPTETPVDSTSTDFPQDQAPGDTTPQTSYDMPGSTSPVDTYGPEDGAPAADDTGFGPASDESGGGFDPAGGGSSYDDRSEGAPTPGSAPAAPTAPAVMAQPSDGFLSWIGGLFVSPIDAMDAAGAPTYVPVPAAAAAPVDDSGDDDAAEGSLYVRKDGSGVSGLGGFMPSTLAGVAAVGALAYLLLRKHK